MTRLLLVVFVMVVYGCGSFSSPHENFKSHMSSTVGKTISDPGTWAQGERLVSAQALENGNEEYKYEFRGSCFYFFEVETGTGVIVGWRFEGSEIDCAIAP